MDQKRCDYMLKVSNEGFWDWDLKSGRAYLSPRCCELIGCSPDDELFDSVFLQKLVYPEDWQTVFSKLDECIQGRCASFSVECRIVALNGTVRWIENRASVVEHDAHGRAERVVGTVTDINERKQSDERLHNSHVLLNNLSQQVPGALFQTIITPDGHICTPYASEKLRDIYEVEPEQLRENIDAIVERFHPEDRERIFASINDATARISRWECEYRVILPRQGLKWLYGVADLKKADDGTVYFYGIIMDITERKYLEETLSHSRRLLSSILENAPYALFVKDVADQFRVILWNRTAEKIFGIPADRILGRNAHDLWPREQADAFLENDRMVVSSRSMVDIPEEVSRHPEKGLVFLHTRKVPLFDANGDVSHIVVICDDISEHRMMLNELVKTQKLESLGVLAGGIAHDFKNILTGVIGYISLARSFIDSSHRSLAIMLEAEKAAGRATDLANQLLTFAKGSEPVKKATSIRQIIDESVSFILRGTSVSGRVEIPAGLPAVEVDAGQISQVFNNILINAVQAMPQGGTITIRGELAALGEANVMSVPPGAYVRITLADTGCGIAEHELPRIFDPYYSTKEGGNGLGLASAYSIVVKHRGYIGAQSRPGTGTIFEILLPVSDEDAANHSHGSDVIECAGDRELSILVMDDEELIREMASLMLETLGYRVRTCADGTDAIRMYQEAVAAGTGYAAVIMDLTVPGGMGGREAAQRIQQIDPRACLIVSSGYSDDPIMADHARYGFCATLLKPYNVSEISRTLATVLETCVAG